jgi:hypothetical protein
MSTKNEQFAKNSTKNNRFGSGPKTEKSLLSKQEIAKQKIKDRLEAKKMIQELAGEKNQILDNQLNEDLKVEGLSGVSDEKLGIEAQKINQERESILSSGKNKISELANRWGDFFDSIAVGLKQGVSKIIESGRNSAYYQSNGFQGIKDENSQEKKVPYVKERAVKESKALPETNKKLSRRDQVSSDNSSNNNPQDIAPDNASLDLAHQQIISDLNNSENQQIVIDQIDGKNQNMDESLVKTPSTVEWLSSQNLTQKQIDDLKNNTFSAKVEVPGDKIDEPLASQKIDNNIVVNKNSAVDSQVVSSPESKNSVIKDNLDQEIAACKLRIKQAEKAMDRKALFQENDLLDELEAKKASSLKENPVQNNELSDKDKKIKELQENLNIIDTYIKQCRDKITVAEKPDVNGSYDEEVVAKNQKLIFLLEDKRQEIIQKISEVNQENIVPEISAPETKEPTSEPSAENINQGDQVVEPETQPSPETSLSPEEILSEKLNNLSAGQQKFISEALSQLYLEKIRSQAREQFQKDNSGKNWFKQALSGIGKNRKIANLEKSYANKKENESDPARLAYTDYLIDVAQKIAVDIKEDNGKLLFDFNNFPDLSKECSETFEKFNHKASEFGSLPQEWSFDSANKTEKGQFAKEKAEYEQLREELYQKLLAEKGERRAVLAINNIDSQIAMRQFITNDKNSVASLNKIKDNSPLKRIWNSLATTNSLAAGLGAVSKGGAKLGFAIAGGLGTAAFMVTLPAIAGGFGAWRAKLRADKDIKESDIEGRHENIALSALADSRNASLKDLQSLVPAEFSLDPKTWLEERATEEEKTLYLKLKENFDKVNKEFEKKELGLSRNKKGEIKSVDRGIEANISQAEDLTEKLKYLLNRLEQARDQSDFAKIDKLGSEIALRRKFSQSKLEAGLINFGTKEQRLLKYLEFNQVLEQAKVQEYYTDNYEKVNSRLGKFMDYLKGNITDERSYYRNKKMVNGALMGVGFYFAGSAVAHKLGAIYEGSGLQDKVGETLGYLKNSWNDYFDQGANEAAPMIKNGGMEISNVSNFPQEPVANESATIPFADPEVPTPETEIPQSPEVVSGGKPVLVEEASKMPKMYDDQGRQISHFDNQGNAILNDGQLVSKEALSGEIELPNDGGSVEAAPDDPAPADLQKTELGSGASAFKNEAVALPDDGGSVEAINTDNDLPQLLHNDGNVTSSMDSALPDNNGEVSAVMDNPVKEIIKTSDSFSELPNDSGDVQAFEDAKSAVSEALKDQNELASANLPDNNGDVQALVSPEVVEQASAPINNSDLLDDTSSSVEAVNLEEGDNLSGEEFLKNTDADFLKKYGVDLSPNDSKVSAFNELDVKIPEEVKPGASLPENSTVESSDFDDDYNNVIDDQENFEKVNQVTKVENIVENGKNIQRVSETVNFNNISKNIAASNIKDQLAQGLFTGDKEFKTSEAFLKKFQELNQGREISDSHKEAAKKIWEQWQRNQGGSSAYQNIIKTKLNLLEKQIIYNVPLKK